MRRKVVIVGVGTLLAIGLGFALFMSQQSRPVVSSARTARVSQAPPDLRPAGTAETPLRQGNQATESGREMADVLLLERWKNSSLRGAEVDGEIALDGAGQLILDQGLRQLFEHFISLTGEFNTADIRRLLILHVQATHGDAVMRAVLAAFDRYLGMRNALAQLPPGDDLATRFAAIRKIREQWFGEASDVMFADEHALAAQTLARMAIADNPALTPAERQQQLSDFDASRPAAELVTERIALGAHLAEEQTQQLDGMHADDNARFAERSALWGDEAAQRLATLDQSRLHWDQRVSDYVSQRQRIQQNSRLSTSARQAALAALLASRFSGNERVRIESLEAVGALPGG